MIIKKFQAESEKAAILLAKNELGKDAIVMNIKTINPKGIYKLFKKSLVEITAAIDDSVSISNDNMYHTIKEIADIGERQEYHTNSFNKSMTNVNKKEDNTYYANKESAIEEKLNNLQELLESQLVKKEESSVADTEKNTKNEYLQLIYKQLIHNEVDEVYGNEIINEIEASLESCLDKDITMDKLLASVYQKIVLKLGQSEEITFDKNQPKFVFFIGPTGVGKTTTIAKIASSLKMNQNAKVALLTSDTYRIAAVEQLRIYANILSVPIKVIYSETEMLEAKEEFSDYDIILVDTAGRSHKNVDQRNDLLSLLDTVDDKDKEIYLVLSATTKYNDLLKIMASYSEVKDFRLIFTKLDETSCIGNILNIKMATNASLSYMTWGQNVPDDIGKIDAQHIAKQLLGGNG